MYWREATTSIVTDLLWNCRRLGLVTDMDGTISPIVNRPEDAWVTDRNRSLLDQLSDLLALVAVVSGRALDDVRSRVALPKLVYSGNHGLTRWDHNSVTVDPEALEYIPLIQKLGDVLRGLPEEFEGMTLEDNSLSFTVHYRNTSNPDEVRAKLEGRMQELASSRGLRLTEGRKVFEFRVPLSIDKGVILGQLVNEYHLDGVIYLGDDTTDLDAMRKARSLRNDRRCRAISVGVLSSEAPKGLRETADVLATGVTDVEDFLSWLLESLTVER